MEIHSAQKRLKDDNMLNNTYIYTYILLGTPTLCPVGEQVQAIILSFQT